MSGSIETIDLAVGYKSSPLTECGAGRIESFSSRRRTGLPSGHEWHRQVDPVENALQNSAAFSGSVKLDGVDLQKLSQIELARRLGIVLTERPMVGALAARRIVELGRYPYWDWSGRMTPKDHEVVDWAIEAVGAGHLASRDCMSLSDGERQRFMIARALAQEPSILLLDEPTAFLDVPSRVELLGLLRRLARQEQLAIVVSTHDLELALRMADTIWLVSPGNKVDTGTPEDVIFAGAWPKHFRRKQSDSIRNSVRSGS